MYNSEITITIQKYHLAHGLSSSIARVFNPLPLARVGGSQGRLEKPTWVLRLAANMERFLRLKLPKGRFEGVPAQRSRMMGRIRGKGNRTTELQVRLALVRNGLSGWLMHANLAGTPDFYFPRDRLAVFIDGCFWHGCRGCGHVPKTNRPFWAAKIRRNRQRARRVQAELARSGIRVLRFWEHEVKCDLSGVVSTVRNFCSHGVLACR
jgi:DNA mismatch endonuclease (patch repair protein)